MRRLMLLTTAAATFAFATMGAIAVAAEGEHHGEGPKGPPPKIDAPHVVPSPEMHKLDVHEHGHGPVVPPKDIPHEGGVSIFGGQEHRPDGWRYRYEKGVWWYWGPSNRWMHYDNGDWQNYAVDEAPVVAAPVASDPNFYWYNKQWWYLRGDHWLIYDHNKWSDGPAGVHPPRREMGHGPVERSPHEEMHHEEHEHK